MADTITDDRFSAVVRMMAEAGRRTLKDLNPDDAALEQLLHIYADALAAHIAEGVRCFASEKPGHFLANQILGEDFISPADLEIHTQVTYTREQVTALEGSLPDKATLMQLRAADMILVPGPPTTMNVNDIYDMYADDFDHGNDTELYDHPDEVAMLGWIAMRKYLVPGSVIQTWTAQSDMVKRPQTILNIAETAWCITACSATRDHRLLETEYARTSSSMLRPDFGIPQRVNIGGFTSDGIQIDMEAADDELECVGVVSGRRFLHMD